ncbi:DNA topoisomerase VI subunit B [archaeon]|nr:DNA topoisomerase VI subunit B [archaeon]|tara:strand:- start:9092 stop:10678 length:1587 start_codon:yes stop_codon:yes gene_type:complete
MVNNQEKKITAEELSKKHREISVAEFFTKNRHLLGFDNPIRALLMTVKEAVDNSLDACNEIHILPEIYVEIQELSETRYKVIIEDNGPGIVKANIPKVFGKLLYGSKFHRLRQSRGSQGIGISASVLYSQLTTGKSTKILSKISKGKQAHQYELNIDTKTNSPNVIKDENADWDKDHGTRIELELEGKYQKGKQSVDEYIKQVAIVNPDAHITYITPEKERQDFLRGTNELAKEPKEIKPHPYGIELGNLIQMLSITTTRTLQSFLTQDFSRIGPGTAKDICAKAKLSANTKPKNMDRQEAEQLFKAMQETKVMAPPTDCLSPIGADILERGLQKEVNADFYVTTTRPTSVYRGFPFVVEAGIAYGGDIEKESQVRLMRFANKVPLLYQQGACAITKSLGETKWKSYGLNQSGSNMPTGPAIVVLHLASVWVPFTSEAKDAVAHYDAIIKEIKLALQECGRKLNTYIRKHIRAAEQRQKIDLFGKYIPELAASLSHLTNKKEEVILKKLEKTLKKELPTLESENGEKK